MDRYELMKAGVREVQPTPSSILPINSVPQMPALPMAQPAPVPGAAPAATTQP